MTQLISLLLYFRRDKVRFRRFYILRCASGESFFIWRLEHHTSLLCCYINCKYYMSHVLRKPAFCICKNKDADQLRGNREADQRLCFHYTDSTSPLLPKSEISSVQPSCVAVPVFSQLSINQLFFQRNIPLFYCGRVGKVAEFQRS